MGVEFGADEYCMVMEEFTSSNKYYHDEIGSIWGNEKDFFEDMRVRYSEYEFNDGYT